VNKLEIKDLVQVVFQYGGTVIMAMLFVYVFFQDRTKNNKLLEDNTKMLESLSRSNDNIAKALDIISNNLLTLDDKVDRNFESILDGRREIK
jgi:hypothetical protein